MAWAVFERAAGLEVSGDAGRAKHVAAELHLEAGIGRAMTDHAVGIDAVHQLVSQHAGLADRRTEEGGLACAGGSPARDDSLSTAQPGSHETPRWRKPDSNPRSRWVICELSSYTPGCSIR